MADTFLCKPLDLTSTSATTIYTVPTTDDTAVPSTASTTALIKSILVSEDTITVTLTRDSAVFSLFKVKAVAANTTIELLTQPLVANEGDIIKVTAATANRLHVVLSVLEIT